MLYKPDKNICMSETRTTINNSLTKKSSDLTIINTSSCNVSGFKLSY